MYLSWSSVYAGYGKVTVSGLNINVGLPHLLTYEVLFC
jgi:hypothetical protein